MPETNRPLARFFAPKYVVMPIVAFFAFWGFYGEQNILIETHQTIEISNLPAETPPLRIALLADLHIGSPSWGLDRLEKLVERVNEANPDLVLIAGDFSISNVVGGTFVSPEEFTPALTKLTAKMGVHVVFGNHDWRDSPTSLVAEFDKHNISRLDAKTTSFEWHGSTIQLIGIPDDVTQRPDIKELMKTLTPQNTDAITILITHNPGIYLDLSPDTQVDLMVAGHTHGGQVNIPFFDPVFMPTRAPYEWAHGLIETKNGPLFVTSGVGTSIFPVRFNQPPEIAILTLIPTQKANDHE